MPGPVSDSYDPEFGTAENNSIVAEATRELRDRISTVLGAKLRPIVHVCQDKTSAIVDVKMSERDLRIIRFNLNRSLESM